MAWPPPKIVEEGCVTHHRARPKRAMFEHEAWFMMLPIAMMVIGFLAALVIPTYLGRARIGACEQRGGTWVAKQGCQGGLGDVP